MANEEQVALLRQGGNGWNAWREANPDIKPDLPRANLIYTHLAYTHLTYANLAYANLTGANLAGADLTGANLTDANLTGANLAGADLNSADLVRADLSGAQLNGADLRGALLARAQLWDAHLSGANLSDAILFYAILYKADLSGADLSDTDLKMASLTDSHLDGANLTGAKLWETQRGGWSIKGVICQRAFWDRDGKEATEYEDGAFERIFAEKPRIVLRYAGGMSPVELAMLPLIIERLQADHPNSSLHIRSVQDEGSGATVTITVEDLADRSAKVFAQDVEALRGDLVMVQQRLQQEEQLRLAFESKYSAVVRDVLPMMLERALPKTEVNIGQIFGPNTIEGTTMSGDTYNIPGQAGAVGPGAQAQHNTFQQIQAGIDLPKLADELKQLRAAMKEADDKDDQDEAIGAVAAAEKAAVKGDGQTAIQHLKTAGTWALGIAEKIGVSVAAEAIKRAM